MLTIIDRYILKKFYTTFFFGLILFLFIAVAIDVSEHMDDFVTSGLSFKEVFFQFYLGFIPSMGALLFPLFVFVSVIVFTSKMALHAEVIAIRAAGASYFRFLRPYLVGGFFLALLHWVGINYVIPPLSEKQNNFTLTYIDHNNPFHKKFYTAIYLRADTNQYAVFKYYDVNTLTASPFYMDEVKNHHLVSRWRALRLVWNEKKKYWMGYNVLFTKMGESKNVDIQYDSLAFKIKIAPSNLIPNKYMKDNLSTPSLNKYIEEEQLRGSEGINLLWIEKYKRTATPFSVIMLCVMGALIAAQHSRHNKSAYIAWGFAIVGGYLLLDRFSNVFAVNASFPPLLAAWTPNIVFLFVLGFIYKKMAR